MNIQDTLSTFPEYAKDIKLNYSKIINENNGTNETKTSFKISERGGISSAAGFGAKDGLKYALIIT